MLPKQVVSYRQLAEEGLTKKEILRLVSSLKLFPTPFKGIYYVPTNEERKAWFIEKPLRVLTMATAIFLGTDNFYYTCETAEEYFGIRWRPTKRVHITNEKMSRKINLAERIKRNLSKRTFRAKKLARILSFYGDEIVFHRRQSIEKAKTKATPFGKFALRQQITKDRKTFKCLNKKEEGGK
ncbi:MAG: hypothetical protein ACPL06_01515 [Candidatus Anstonellales archaeon]